MLAACLFDKKIKSGITSGHICEAWSHNSWVSNLDDDLHYTPAEVLKLFCLHNLMYSIVTLLSGLSMLVFQSKTTNIHKQTSYMKICMCKLIMSRTIKQLMWRLPNKENIRKTHMNRTYYISDVIPLTFEARHEWRAKKIKRRFLCCLSSKRFSFFLFLIAL